MTNDPYDLLIEYNISLMFIPAKKQVDAWYNDTLFTENWGDDKAAAVRRAVYRAAKLAAKKKPT